MRRGVELILSVMIFLQICRPVGGDEYFSILTLIKILVMTVSTDFVC